MRRGIGAARLLTTTTAAVSALLLAAGTAAAVDDSITVYTSDSCGSARFVDYGPGAPGGGDNDDYIEIRDRCGDHHGVRVWMQWTHTDGSQSPAEWYNGNGSDAGPMIWDPFKFHSGNVKAGDRIRLEVCLVDGAADYDGELCQNLSFTSVDG